MPDSRCIGVQEKSRPKPCFFFAVSQDPRLGRRVPQSPFSQLAGRPRLDRVEEDDDVQHPLHNIPVSYLDAAVVPGPVAPASALSSLTSLDDAPFSGIFEDDDGAGTAISPPYLPVSTPTTPAHIGSGVLRPAAEVNAEAGQPARSRSRSEGSASSGSLKRPSQYPRTD